ncbi:hypothetical protein GQ457_03G007750 [Hibiscus cannabinus]
MGSLSKAFLFSTLPSSSSSSSSSSSISPPPFSLSFAVKAPFTCTLTGKNPTTSFLSFSLPSFICKAAEYKFPDPIPEFAHAETDRFRSHLLKKLSKKEDIYGDSVEEVVGICVELFSTFLHTEYGGPGTLLVIPFIDMADTIDERGLPGGPEAARAAVKWATDHVDKDWKEWTGTN